MIYAICNVVTGELLQTSESPLSVSGHPLQVKTFADADLSKMEWDRGGLNFKPKATSRIVTKLEYLRRFTGDERVNIRAVAKSNPVLEDYMALLELSEEINLDDPDTVAAQFVAFVMSVSIATALISSAEPVMVVAELATMATEVALLIFVKSVAATEVSVIVNVLLPPALA